MKKIFTLVLASACLWGCVQKSEIDDLQKQIDDLKAGEIATMSAQIAGIQTSLGDLQRVDTELRGLIKTLQDELSAIDEGDDEKYEAIQRELASLASADEALGQRISDLKNYCDQQDNGVRDWVSLTFTTLEQHSAVLSEIAAIKIRLGQLESALTSLDTTLSQKISDAEARVMAAISTSETSIKGWVNEQLSGYYTIAQADAKLKLLEDAYKAADETLAGDISTLRSDLTTAVTNLTSAYQTAISDAITANNGVINAKIASDIQAATSALQTQIDAITTRITNLESRVGALEAAVAKIIGMVQSIVVVPDYSDGSVKLAKVADNELRFEVYPLEAAALIAETEASILSLDYVETLTKSSEEFFNLPITAVDFTGKTLLITVDGTGLPDTIVEGSTTANARLKISDGTNTRSSEYFPIYRSESGSDDGVAKTGESADVGESSAKLYGWSTQDGVAGASVVFGIEYSATDLTTDAITLRADDKDSNNKYCCQATGLSSNTLYYYRAFTLYNGIRTYGEVRTFNTKEINATVTTMEATNIGVVTATLNGTLSVVLQEELSKEVGFLCSAMASDLESLKTSGMCFNVSLNEDGSFSVAPTDFPLATTLYYVAWARVYDKEFYGEVVSFSTNALPEGPVDMGLSVMWASCNLCETGFVSSPGECGDYYAWGETEIKDDYSWATYKFGTSSSGPFSKYNTNSSYGTIDNNTILDTGVDGDDVASKKLGDKWRMPTNEEWEELRTQCSWTWATLNGINGRLVTASNGNGIFLPAAGRRSGTNFNNFGSVCGYWSSSLNTDTPNNAWYFYSNNNSVGGTSSSRYFGYPVRPVYGDPQIPDLMTISEALQTDYAHVKGTVMAICNRGYVLADETGAILCYYGSTFQASNYKQGDVIEIANATSAYNYGPQLDCSGKLAFDLEKKVSEGSGSVAYPTPRTSDQEALAALIESVSGKDKTKINDALTMEYVRVIGTPRQSGAYINIYLDDYTAADFSAYQLPASFDLTSMLDKKVTIYGYLQSISGGKHVNIVVTSLEEGAAEDPEDYFVASFAESVEGFTWENVTLPEGITYVWKYDTANHYLKASSYFSGARHASESIAVSPEIDLTDATHAYLSFQHVGKNFASAESIRDMISAEVKVGYTWHKLAVPNMFTNADWTFVGSGDLDMSEYVGNKVRIGFRYVSTADNCGTWEVKQVKVCNYTSE